MALPAQTAGRKSFSESGLKIPNHPHPPQAFTGGQFRQAKFIPAGQRMYTKSPGKNQ
jgi:hypothetical protein